MRTQVPMGGYNAKDVVAINDRNGTAIIRATGGGFIRREERPRTYWGYVNLPHRKLGAALKAAGFNKAEREEVLSLEGEGPFNLALHDFMISNGATYTRLAESFEDVGDAENGPELAGHPALDVYVLDDIDYAIDEKGIVDRAPHVPDFDTQGIECDAVSR